MEKFQYLRPLPPLRPRDHFTAMLTVLALLILMTTCSCWSSRQTVREKETNDEKVRIEYREIIRTDTVTVQLPAERIEVIRRDSSHLETNLAASDARIQPDGTIYHTLRNKLFTPKIEVQYKDREIIRDSIVYQTKEIPYPVEKELTRWQKFRMDIGGYAVFALLGMVIFYGIKVVRKII